MGTAPLSPQIPRLEEVPRVRGAVHNKIDKQPHKIGVFISYAVFCLKKKNALSHLFSYLSYVYHSSGFGIFLLGVTILVTLGFELVNGFHDTKNAAATKIYTHSL